MGTNLKISMVTLGMTIILVTGCKKDSNNVLVTKMKATIDGTEWNTTARATVKNDNGFIITGTHVSTTLVTSTLVINISGHTTGTYNVIGTSNNCLATYTPVVSNASESFISITGTVNLTEINTSDKTISGTFEFSCLNLEQIVEITGGSFTDLSYTESSGD
jgi:hypothetical protein